MRLFIALPLPGEIEEHLGKAIFALKQKKGKVKWVAPKNIHLTVKFLGEVEEDKLGEITSRLDNIAQNNEAIHSMVHNVGAFPNLFHPKVIWAGLEGDTDRMEKIAVEIEEAMAPLGFEREERRFKPHLTLGRIKDSRGMEEMTEYIGTFRMTPAPVYLDRIVLFKSTLTPKGPIYERLYEATLANGAA